MTKENLSVPATYSESHSDTLPGFPSSMVNVDTAAFMDYFEKKIATLGEGWRRDLNDAMLPVKSDIKCLSEKLDGWGKRLDDLESRVSALEQSQQENEKLKIEVAEMRRNMDLMDQYSRQCNVEIQGIPETNAENLLGIVSEIGSLIGIKVPAENVRSVHRSAPGANRKGPGHVILQLSTRKLRDDILAAARVRRELRTEQLSTPLPAQRFYVNEHLTLKNKILLAKTRSFAKEKKYKHVWVQDFQIKIRRTDTSKVLKIRTEEDLNNLLVTDTSKVLEVSTASGGFEQFTRYLTTN